MLAAEAAPQGGLGEGVCRGKRVRAVGEGNRRGLSLVVGSWGWRRGTDRTAGTYEGGKQRGVIQSAEDRSACV